VAQGTYFGEKLKKGGEEKKTGTKKKIHSLQQSEGSPAQSRPTFIRETKPTGRKKVHRKGREEGVKERQEKKKGSSLRGWEGRGGKNAMRGDGQSRPSQRVLRKKRRVRRERKRTSKEGGKKVPRGKKRRPAGEGAQRKPKEKYSFAFCLQIQGGKEPQVESKPQKKSGHLKRERFVEKKKGGKKKRGGGGGGGK